MTTDQIILFSLFGTLFGMLLWGRFRYDLGASAAVLTPTGHKNNTPIVGPGGYRFGDYGRMGQPLELIIVAVSIPMPLIAWPL